MHTWYRTCRKLSFLWFILIRVLNRVTWRVLMFWCTQVKAAQEVDDLCSALEGLAGAVAPLSPPLTAGGTGTADDMFAGTWRLVYSSGFNTGSLGGRRPGPPAAIVPATLGQVYQRVDNVAVSESPWMHTHTHASTPLPLL